ncbi:MAG: carbon-nitrogen hydrolase family protein [Anaerovoracaceae bacterium]|jgi:nitrilase
MKDFEKNSCRAALVQMEPVMFRKKETTDKVVEKIEEAAAEGAELIVFPESTIPCYPYGMTFGFVVGERRDPGRDDWQIYYENSVVVPGPETDRIGEAAKKAGAYVSIGITERDAVNATLYCTNLIFDPEGRITKHRKLMPTGAERFIWGEGHDGYFPVVETPWGKMGSLICWENYMPLARVALYDKGISIYLAPNTNDNPEWQDTVHHIAIEGHVYVFNADQYLRRESYPKNLNGADEIAVLNEEPLRGGSTIVDPFGHDIAGPVWGKEAILYADLDMSQVYRSRMEFDGSGHYSRPDVLKLMVEEE